MNLSPDSLHNLKLEISNLWKYAMFQKEICQLLWNKDDLEISSSNKVTINFENLKGTTLIALKELISNFLFLIVIKLQLFYLYENFFVNI